MPSPELLIDARYHPADGSAGKEQWGNFQLDGLGTLMWAVTDHVARHNIADAEVPKNWRAGMFTNIT